MAADGSVIIETKVNDQNVEVTFKDIQDSAKRMATTVDEAGNRTRASIQKQIAAFSELNSTLRETSRATKEANQQEITVTRGNKVTAYKEESQPRTAPIDEGAMQAIEAA